MKEIKNFRIIDITMPIEVGNEFDPYEKSGLSMGDVLLINIGKSHDPFYYKYHHLFLVIEHKEFEQ